MMGCSRSTTTTPVPDPLGTARTALAAMAARDASPPVSAPVDAGTLSRGECDSNANCELGFECCISPYGTGKTTCMQPNVADGEPCTMQACALDGGSPCPAGQGCVAGFCRSAPRERATCEGGLRCPVERPVCNWQNGKGSCVARDDAAPGLACTKKSDCAKGMSCCIVKQMGATSERVTQTECRRACGTLELEDVCESSTECPSFLVTGVNGGLMTQACVPRSATAGLPPWSRQCAPQDH